MQYYKFRFEVTKPFYADIFLGSRWRSVLINAVKKAVCFNTRQKDCKQCIAYNTCGYPYYFDTDININGATIKKNTPYIIDTDSCEPKHYCIGDTIELGLTLLDRADNYARLLIHNLQTVRLGACEDRYNLRLINVTKYTKLSQGLDIWQGGDFSDNQTSLELPSQYYVGNYQLDFYAPLRILHKGRIVTEVTPQLLSSLIKRKLKSYLNFYKIPISIDEIDSFAADDLNITTNHLYKYNWNRYSNRQEKYMMLDGLIGTLAIEVTNTSLAKALYICSLLGLGKGASLGLGRFKLEKL